MIIFQIDAFTDKLFKGNPAGVCVLSNEIPAELMQDIAIEMNLSETAFLLKKGGSFDLRWFTPTTEVDLCGHATLSSAHLLYEMGYLSKDEKAIFNTRSGVLYAQKSDEDYITLDFPREDDSECEPADGLAEAIGSEFLYCGKNRLDWIIEVASVEALKNLSPDMAALSRIGSTIVERENLNRGFIVTTNGSGTPYDFVSRYFAPADGIPEDPVTGSVHCCLAPYWSRKLNKTDFLAYQASKRGGILKLKLTDKRLLISGKAITVMTCNMPL